MEHISVANKSKRSSKNDNRRTTLEVSATMLRDILIGYNEDDIKKNASLGEASNHIMINQRDSTHTQKKNGISLEENSVYPDKGNNHSKKQSLSSSDKNSVTPQEESVNERASVNRPPGFPANPRQRSQDSIRFNLGHRYSPPQGSTGSYVSNKSNSEESVESEISTTTPHASWNSSEGDTDRQGDSILKPDLPPPPPINSSLNLVPPILTSSPLLERKNRGSKLNLIIKKAPYYVGDTRLNSSNASTKSSNDTEISSPPHTSNRYSNKCNNSLNSYSTDIPYEEVFSHLSRQMISNSESKNMYNPALMKAFTQPGCNQEQSSIEEHVLYDESLYRLLPEPELLGRACPNPLYQPEEANSNVISALYYSNVNGIQHEANIASGEEEFHMKIHQNSGLLHFMPESSRSQGAQSFTHVSNKTNDVMSDSSRSLAYCYGHPSFGYEHTMLSNHNGDIDGDGNTILNGSQVGDESAKQTRDNFQQRMLAYHPTHMHLNHRRRNEEEMHQLSPGK